jgi:cytochrome c nitrite reductase small subunit
MPPDTPTRASPDRFSNILANFMLAAAFGVIAGLGMFTFLYAEGLSYFSDNPESCVNCHIMRDQFDEWNHSSHKAVAVCNDCHTPHGSVIEKYIAKGINGWNHSLAFTTGNFPEPIRIKAFNAVITQQNCIDCHSTAINQMHISGDVHEVSCVACHGNVGHGQAGRALHGPIFPDSPTPTNTFNQQTMPEDSALEEVE